MSHQVALTQFGEFVDPQTGETLPFQTLKLEHLPGEPLVPPCWLVYLLRLIRAEWVARLIYPWWIKIPQYRLLEDVFYVDPDGNGWFIKAGFVFNGGSVPWFLWWLCPADHPDALAAFLVHDFCCTEPHPCDFKKAAWLMWAASRCQGFYRWGAWRNWAGVRIFGPRFKTQTGTIVQTDPKP